MGLNERTAGGFFVSVLMIITILPFNNMIQTQATATGATDAVIAFATFFPVLYAGLAFTVLAMTGYEIIKGMT